MKCDRNQERIKFPAGVFSPTPCQSEESLRYHKETALSCPDDEVIEELTREAFSTGPFDKTRSPAMIGLRS